MRRTAQGVCCLLLMFAALVQAEERIRAVVVAVPPYGELQGDRKPAGVYVDVLTAIAQQSGYALELQIAPFPRVNRMIADGETDITVMFNNQILATHAQQIASIAEIDTLLLTTLQHQPADLLQRLTPATVGRLSGGCLDLADKKQFTFYELNNYASGLRMLLRERLDALCSVDLALRFAAREAAIDLSQLRLHVVGHTPVWLHARKDLDPAIVKRLLSAAEQLKKNNRIANVLATYKQ